MLQQLPLLPLQLWAPLHTTVNALEEILEEIWSVIIIMLKPLDLTAAYVHDSALIKEFHLPVGFPSQLSAPAHKLC